MSKYENSSIYKLCCKDVDIKEIYIGSTVNFTRRKHCHKTKCNNENDKSYNFNVYQYIRNNGGWDNWDMIEIEKVNCIDRRELCKIEREFIDKYKSKLNSKSAYTTKEENKEYHQEYRKEYYKENIKKEKELCKEYYKENKEKIKEYYKEYAKQNKETLKERKKIYYENNKDKIRENNKERKKIYYEKNKEKIKEKVSKKINCECGATVRKDVLLRHTRSLKHKKYEESKNKNIKD